MQKNTYEEKNSVRRCVGKKKLKNRGSIKEQKQYQNDEMSISE